MDHTKTPPAAPQAATQLSDKVTRQLLEELRYGRYSAERRLPPEVVVAQHLGVSRNLLRDCLSALEREGFISRKRGVGTIINKHVLDVKVRMDLEEEFLGMVRTAGYAPDVSYVKNSYTTADAEVARHLGLEKGAPVFLSIRLITADGRPVIYCEDYVPKALVKHPGYKPGNPKAPIFDFLENACESEVYMDITEVRPVSATEQLAAELGVAPGAAVLYMDEVGYDFFGSPVLNSREYYVDGIIRHMVMRKKI